MTTLEMRKAVLHMSQQSFAENLFAGTSGNLSLRDPQTGLIAITPGSVDYPTMVLDDVMLITPDGEIVEGRRKPSSEWRMHAEIYKHRTDIHAVVHTHSPYATGFAVTHCRIPVILIEMMFFLLGDVPVARYCTPGTPDLGFAVVEALQNRTACLLANHGVVAVGGTLAEAHIRAVYTEDAAKIFTQAKIIGDVQVISAEEQNKMRRNMGVPEE